MKKKVGIIASAVATTAICASMIVGATYALFTSNSEVEMTVTAGNVSIVAEIVPGESKSTLGEGNALGGFNTANGIALENIAPGDVYSFTVKAVNSSSISIQYRTTIEFTNPMLASALVVTIDDVEYSGLTKYMTAWASKEEKGALNDIEVEIAFPALEESQNQFQNLSTDIKVLVEGVQGNATVSDADRELVFSVNNGAQLEEVVETAKEAEQNATINLVSDVALTEELYIDQFAYDLTLNGNGYKITAAENFAMHIQGQYNLVKINDAVATGVDANGKTTYDLQIHDNTVALKNIVLEHKALTVNSTYHTLDVYGAKDVVLDNVTLIRDGVSAKGGAALTVNASNVTATDLYVVYGGSAWGGINVDGGNGDAVLTLKSGFTYLDKTASKVAVWLEHGGQLVDEENVLQAIPGMSSFVTPAATVNGTVYVTFEEALAAIKDQENVTLTLNCNVAMSANISGLKNVVIDANGYEIIDNVSGYRTLKCENVAIKNAVFNYNAAWGVCTNGVSFYNCTFNGFSPYIVGSQPAVIDGCTFSNTILQFDGVDFSKITITNNTFNVNNVDTGSHAIVLAGGTKDFWESGANGLVLEGNTFNAVYANDTYIAYYIYSGATLTKAPFYANNTYNGKARYSINSTAVANQYKIRANEGAIDFSDEEEVLMTFCPDCYNGKGAHSEHAPYFVMEDGKANVVKAGAWIAYKSLDLDNAKYEFTVDYDLTQLTEGSFISFDCGETKSWQNLKLGFEFKDGKYYAYNTLSAKGVATAKSVELSSANVKATYVFEKVGETLKMTLKLNGVEFATATANLTGWDSATHAISWCPYTAIPAESGEILCTITGMELVKIAK